MNLSPGLVLNDHEYLELPGLNVMLAHDFYPEGHQGGVGFIQNGRRVATNGDIRLEPAPGQWSPVPKVGKRQINRDIQEISVHMAYPDEAKDRKGFNPIEYPELEFGYTIRVRPEGRAFRIIVDLDEPIPEDWVGRVGFNLELFPAHLFGKTYASRRGFGVFPRQASGNQDRVLTQGRQITVAPESDEHRLRIEAISGGDIQLIDGRTNHNNGWFVLRSLVEVDCGKSAVEWLVIPHIIPHWLAPPVIQVSQVGYHPLQRKTVVIELDRGDLDRPNMSLQRIDETGGIQTVLECKPEEWGPFLRFNYLHFDFTSVQDAGMYIVRFGDCASAPFQISESVFDWGVWQPTVEYFLPVQMCHMRVNENYRVWHGTCHLDDASMAPTNHNHFDGYHQGPSTLTGFDSGTHVPGLNRGGWHDAGDYDLRIESQADTVHGLALAFEEFGLTYDNTSVDQQARVVELLRPDGKPDILQQIEHGCLSIVDGYNALGRLYRGIIEPTLRQYTHLGDAATVTDGVIGSGDDRWVFTEENPRREMGAARALAAASRTLVGYDDTLSKECLTIAKALFEGSSSSEPIDRLETAIELYQATGDTTYRPHIVEGVQDSLARIDQFGWLAARALTVVTDEVLSQSVKLALRAHRIHVEALATKTPYGLPYEPAIWGAGWGIQRFGVHQYWLNKGFPELFPIEYMLRAVDFILGCHPGSNTASFVSGVGAKSMIPGYGVNRADESYIPGGIGSGTALIRPDFPELLESPYLWQQTEYCVGYPTSDYIFLIAAASHCLHRLQEQGL